MTSPAKIWTVVDLISQTQGYFQKCGIASARLDAELLLAHCLRKSRVQLYLDFECPLTDAELSRFRDLVRRRGRREPVAYITGFREFWTLQLSVTPDVLIPRPETELLVEEVLRAVTSGAIPARGSILDIGTGSGALALALATELPEASVCAIDASEKALQVARGNAGRAGVVSRIEFMAGNSLGAVPAGRVFDAAVSNPPYIPSGEIDSLEPEIKNFEPRMALDGGPDGLAFYRGLIPQLHTVLGLGGFVALEIGHRQGPAVSGLFAAAGRYGAIRVLKDYAQQPRVVTAVRCA